MGQIVIDIPTRKHRHYVLRDAKRVKEILAALDATATAINDTSRVFTPDEVEDLEDLRDAEAAIAEYRRTGISYSLDEIRAEIGL